MFDSIESNPDLVLRVLTRARGYIERGWCQDWLARDADGNRVDAVTNPRAVAFCAGGAIERAGVDEFDAHRSWIEDRGLIWFKVANHIPANTAIAVWNDGVCSRHATVLAGFDHAIDERIKYLEARKLAHVS